MVSWINAKVRITTSWRPGAEGANSVEELDEQGQQEIAALGRDASEDEINAIYRRGQARFAQKRWPQRNAATGAGAPRPRDAGVRAPPRAEGGDDVP